MKEKIALAFSGGLDTSFCVKYLSQEKGFEVHSVFVNTGSFTEKQVAEIEKKAYSLGVARHENVDVTDTYYYRCIRYLIFGNMLRNKTYPMSVSSERTFQAIAVADYAAKNNIGYIAHGSTGAGNDQVRFDLVFNVMNPGVKIVAPIRDLRLSREEETEYLKKSGVSESFSQYEYSINQGLWGTSVGGKETLTSHLGLPENAFPGQIEIGESRQIEVEFKNGELAGGVDSIRNIQQLGSSFAIGRGIHVGETIIGIRGRVGFEAAAPLIIIQAHQALEKHVLSKWQIYWKDQLSEWYGMMLHEGQYLDPVMRDIEVFLENSQKTVSGKVFVKLRPYTFSIEGISSDYDLMQASDSQYGEMNKGFTGEDVKGFTRILSNPMRIYYSINDKPEVYK